MRCDNCEKRKGERKCKVLTKMIGKKRDCWAWSNDPLWEQKADMAVQEYSPNRRA